MRIGPRVGLLALGLVAAAASAQSPHRLIVIVGRPDDPRVAQQHATLEGDAAALRERDVVVQDITPEIARRELPGLDVDANASFEVLLFGKDGGVKLRRGAPVSVAEISALIDTMPMRRNEMRR